MLSSALKAAALAVGVGFLVTGPAGAVPIDYIFTGAATGTLGGTAFDTTFTVDIASDTSTATLSGGEWFNTATGATFNLSGVGSGTLLGVFNEVVGNPTFDLTDGAAIFGQLYTPDGGITFDFSGEGLYNVPLASYDLQTAFPLTGGTVSQTPNSLYQTSLGDLVFANISSMSFEADVATTPLPATLPLFASGLGALGLLGLRRKRKAAALAA